MKKILLSILTILGIGLSFCSADGIYHNSDLGLISVVLNGSTVYTLQDKNLGATCSDITNSCSYGKAYQWGNNYPFDLHSYSQGSCISNFSNYGPGNYFNSNGVFCTWNSPGNYPNLWGAVTKTNESMQGPCDDGFHLVYDWSEVVSNLSTKYTVDGTFLKTKLLLPTQGTVGIYSFGSNPTYYTQSYTHSNINQNNMYQMYIRTDGSLGFQDTYIANGNPVRCFKNELINPDYTWVVLIGDTIDPPANPKFIVNYGGTSYEYILEYNLEIKLNSPVVKNGDTYSYNGSTGINLFYNGTSLFYSKDKLYLFTPSRYSNNIFTPICL